MMAGNDPNKHDYAPLGDPPKVDMGEKKDMTLVVEGNRFPRETGHDSLTPEEAQLS